jgi:hypothetical protein
MPGAQLTGGEGEPGNERPATMPAAQWPEEESGNESVESRPGTNRRAVRVDLLDC